jgi:hypothetical protein
MLNPLGSIMTTSLSKAKGTSGIMEHGDYWTKGIEN